MPDPTIGRGMAAPPSITALYDAHAELVWRCLHRLGVRTADVPDLLQEVFLVVHRRRDELDARPIEPFLWGIAVGLVRNYRRKAFRRHEVARDVPDATSDASPERDLFRAEERRAVERALEALDPDKRAVFVMYELEGLSGQDIAAALEVPLGTVHSRLHSARRELRAALEAHTEGRTA